ncbi:hypothetical protein SDC9_119374 [bioreactor metagenome]|uniref:Uncharacterized protein n=1 Tax=bioreactor metagenome TaxID=1076179 RepID=A0A645C4U5_9ZZZZ
MQARQGGPPGGDLLQPCRIGLQSVEVAGQVRTEVVELVDELAGACRQRRGLRVGLGDRLQSVPGDADEGGRPR